MDEINKAQVNFTGRVRQAVSGYLGCEPTPGTDGLEWPLTTRPGIRFAILRHASGGVQQLDVILAYVQETANSRVHTLWDLVATLVRETDLTVIPIAPTRDAGNGKWRIAARVTLKDAALDLPRLNRLNSALELLDRGARTLQAEVPSATGSAPVVPRPLKAIAEPLTARAVKDSKVGDVSAHIVSLLQSGLPVAMVGTPLRVRLELTRLTQAARGIVVLRRMVPIQDLPHLARAARDSGLILATACALLRPRMSVYEQGREVEATLRELAARALPVLTFGTREELEALFSVGQGRSYSPLSPVIESLPPAQDRDLVQAALAERCDGLPPEHADRLTELVLRTISRRVQEKDHLLQPLANLAAQKGAENPELPAALITLAEDLAGRRDTFGTCDEAPAVPRTSEVCRHLTQRLVSSELEDLLRSRVFGQGDAINELTKRIRREAVCRPQAEPLRLMLAGPVGTGKSVAAKYIAEVLGWPCHYIDATAFDSEHAVMTSLAGASPGIVNSYNDGALARISRRTSVVEIADLDHARPGVRGALCEFFLRILQEGTLQTGSGMIVRSLPSVIFVFTSNIAYGTHKASAHFGFGRLTRDDIRQRVVSRVLEHLGHAFVSRVGEPVLFDEFTYDTAVELATMEIRSLVSRVTGATRVMVAQRVVDRILDSLPTMENGARGVIDATRSALSEALLNRADMGVAEVDVRLEEDDIMVEPSIVTAEKDGQEQVAARPS